MLPRGGLVVWDATLLSPFQNGPVRKLEELGVLLQKPVQPVESALVWKPNWEDNLALSAVRRSIDTICGTCLRNCVAFEWKWHHLRTKVHLKRHVLEANVGKKRLAHEGIRKLLRLRHADTIAEKANSVFVVALVVQIKQHRQNLVSLKSLRHRLLLCFLAGEETFIVEEHAFICLAQQKGALLCGETEPHQISRSWRCSATRSTLRWCQ
mmetsp:Transcript_18635/g.32649  ORF Transcript_18635/g.32649 Transcript_18635/m.32649 type:complete len:210 (-) Transcript_18635:371-1000(-)